MNIPPIVARLAKTFSAHAILQGILLLIRVLEIPIFLTIWTPEQYGIWLIVSALPFAIAFSDGGISKTISREVAMLRGNGSHANAQKMTEAGQSILQFSSLAILVISTLAAITFYLDPSASEIITNQAPSEYLIAACLLTSQATISLLTFFFYGIASAKGNSAPATMALAFNFGAIFLCQIAALVYFKTPIHVAAAGLFAALASACLMAKIAGLKPLQRSKMKLLDSYHQIKPLIKPSIANLAFPISEALNIQAMRVVVGIALGPTSLVAFTVARTLARIALQPVLSIPRTIEPELAMCWGRGEQNTAKNIVNRATIISAIAAISIAAIVFAFRAPILQNWTLGLVAVDTSVLIALLAASILTAIHTTSMALLVATNHHSIMAPFHLVFFGILPVICAYLLNPDSAIEVALIIVCADLLTLINTIFFRQITKIDEKNCF